MKKYKEKIACESSQRNRKKLEEGVTEKSRDNSKKQITESWEIKQKEAKVYWQNREKSKNEFQICYEMLDSSLIF